MARRNLANKLGLKLYSNIVTGELRKSLKPLDSAEWVPVLQSPNSKFMITGDAEHAISKLKDQDKILKARARNYSRDHEIDENIQINKANGLDENVTKSFLNSKGQKRTKLDDL